MFTVVPIFDIFTYYTCLFCSHIVVNIMEFDATVIQVRGLFNNFRHKKMPVPSKEYDSCYPLV